MSVFDELPSAPCHDPLANPLAAVIDEFVRASGADSRPGHGRRDDDAGGSVRRNRPSQPRRRSTFSGYSYSNSAELFPQEIRAVKAPLWT